MVIAVAIVSAINPINLAGFIGTFLHCWETTTALRGFEWAAQGFYTCSNRSPSLSTMKKPAWHLCQTGCESP
jgi:hypothetical protein